jgi:hypothetical protein
MAAAREQSEQRCRSHSHRYTRAKHCCLSQRRVEEVVLVIASAPALPVPKWPYRKPYIHPATRVCEKK